MKSCLTVYKASAGSGKTFTLAVQYIKALVEQGNGQAHSHILAVTFTNKATGEMKDRILQQLYGIWKGLPASEAYFAVLKEGLREDGVDLADDEVRRRAGTALCNLLHDYDRFRVETIDSFFQSVLKNLAHELNLTANLKVDLNDQQAVNAAVDRIMERLYLTPTVLNWIYEYVDDRITNNERWDIAREVKSFGTWIFKEAYLHHEKALQEALHDQARLKFFREAMHEEIDEAMDIVQSAVENFREELEDTDMELGQFSNGGDIATYLNRLEAGNLNPSFGKRMQGFVDSADNWLRKKDQKNPELREAAAHFHELLAELRSFQLDSLVRHNSATLALKHLNALRLLGVIDAEVTALNNELNRFLLAKTPILLHDLIEDHDAPFIFEKMGAFIHHVMLDEFQDTSTMQWKNFKILLLENMAAGHGNLVVGDVKQSIYRWRNGDWTILDRIGEEMAAFAPDIRSLKMNRRSERRIIDFNNALFAAAAEQLDRLSPDAPIRIAQAYADVAQTYPADKAEKGFVRVRFYNDGKGGEDWEEQMLDELCDQVETLHAQGLPYGEMAILVRQHKFTTPIVRHFAKRFGNTVKIVSDEAFLLSSSKAVGMLVAAMRYLVDETDRVSLAYLALHTGGHDDVGQLSPHALESLLPEAFTAQKETLRTLPLYELQETLYRLFDLGSIPDEDAYVFIYFDQVTTYLEDNPSDLHSFLTHWDESLSTLSIPSGEVDGIRVYTIHKSKGLEFHTVFAPYCNFELEKDRKENLLWCEPDRVPYDTLPVIPISIQSAMANSIFAKDYEEEHLQRRVDALNMLYVAFTRAGKNLFAWCPTSYKMDKSDRSAADLIYVSLPRGLEGAVETEDENGHTELFTYGTLETVTGGAKKAATANRMETDYRPQEVRMHSYEARIEFCQSRDAEDFLDSMADEADAQTARTDKRRLGILMHKIFSTIYTRHDVDKALLNLENEGEIGSRPEKERLSRQMGHALSQPEVAHWFDGSMKLYNECPILTQTYCEETGKYDTYRPDRVMLSDTETIVVDFKFGRTRAEYRDQVGAYMALLRQMEPGRTVKGYLWYISQNRLEPVEA